MLAFYYFEVRFIQELTSSETVTYSLMNNCVRNKKYVIRTNIKLADSADTGNCFN